MKSQDQPITTSRQIHTYTELEQQIHEDLRTQHPEWIEPTGECRKCNEHEARLRELLDALIRKGTHRVSFVRCRNRRRRSANGIRRQ